MIDEEDFIPAHMLEKVELPPQQDGVVEYHSTPAGDEHFKFPKTDGFYTVGDRPMEVNRLTPKMYYKKPKWWQFRLKRKYRKLLTTNND